MRKDEIALYLVSLHTLLEAQSKAAGGVPNTVLADEYEKHWAMLKSTITQENDNEARQSDNERQRQQDRTSQHGDQSGLRR